MPAPLLTNGNVIEYLDMALGIKVPEAVVTHAVEKVEGAQASITAAGYTHADQVLIELYAAVIIAASGAPRRVTSQHAASGAARGFKYADGDLSALRRSLAALDTAGTVTALVGPDPSAATLFMVV